MPSPAFKINGGAVGAKAQVAAASTVTATLDSTDGVRQTAWSIIGTDELSEPGDYTLVQSGSVGQTVTITALGIGTAALLRSTINGGIDLATDTNNPVTTTATGKFFVPTDQGLEVGCAGEQLESSPVHGSAEFLNEAIREIDASAAPGAQGKVTVATATISYFNLEGLAEGVTTFTRQFSIEGVASALPAGARYAGHSVEDVTAFDDGAGGTITVKIGSPTDDDRLTTNANVSAPTGYPKTEQPPNVYPGLPLYAEQYNMIMTNVTGNDLNDCVSGSVMAKIFFFVP